MRMDIFDVDHGACAVLGSARLCLPIYATPRPGNRTCTRLLQGSGALEPPGRRKSLGESLSVTKGKAPERSEAQMQSIAMVYQKLQWEKMNQCLKAFSCTRSRG